MKKIFFGKHHGQIIGATQKRKNKVSGILTLFILLFIIGGMIISGAGHSQDIILSMISPVSKIIISFSDKALSFMRPIFHFNDLIENNRVLKKENKKLIIELVTKDKLKTENDLLRKQLSLNASDSFTLKQARIVNFDPFYLTHYGIIDKGYDDGITKGMAVILPGNILLGQVSETFSRHARIMLLSEKSNKISVKSLRSNSNGVLNGSSGNMLFMDLIEKNALLEPGDVIITSGIDGSYPSHLIIGKVRSIVENNKNIFKQAYIDPDYASLSYPMVFVLMR